ncbi:MAG: hypothetical protein HFJ42_02270 [Clostridia bacterium]|nr:hypothetical protein [Clostridia bacterium]
MEQIIKMAQNVYERRISKTMELKEQENAEKNAEEERIGKEAKELGKLVIRLFGASNKEEGDYRISNIMLRKSNQTCNILCTVRFEKDKYEVPQYKGYMELINLPYISKAIDKINNQKYDAKVLYETMNIISEIENYYISGWSEGDYKASEKCAELVTFAM